MGYHADRIPVIQLEKREALDPRVLSESPKLLPPFGGPSRMKRLVPLAVLIDEMVRYWYQALPELGTDA
ncbi:MAG: hypothetical protein M3R52_08000 [Acidobacteriota bacterium]|nr:hypothetical protein [Acidobacteriota bacterium]